MAPKATPKTQTPAGRPRETLPAPTASDVTTPVPETIAEREAAAPAAPPAKE